MKIIRKLKADAFRYGWSDCKLVYVQMENKDGTLLVRTFCGNLVNVKKFELENI